MFAYDNVVESIIQFTSLIYENITQIIIMFDTGIHGARRILWFLKPQFNLLMTNDIHINITIVQAC